MNTAALLRILSAIRDAYEQILRKSLAVSETSGTDVLTELIESRARLLERVSREQSRLNDTATGWQSLCMRDARLADMVQEIRSLIYAVTENDVSLQTLYRQRLQGIRDELFSLPRMVQAACAYAYSGGTSGPALRQQMR
jgi:hypothetical protein